MCEKKLLFIRVSSLNLTFYHFQILVLKYSFLFLEGFSSIPKTKIVRHVILVLALIIIDIKHPYYYFVGIDDCVTCFGGVEES